MRVLETELGHQRRSLHTARNEVLAEIQDALRELRSAFITLAVAVAGPYEFGEGRGARPHFGAEDNIVNLLGPEGRDGADDKLLLRVVETLCEVVVVDALPGLVGCTPGASVAAVVEIGVGCVRVRLDVVTLVVADPAAVTAVEVHEVG